MIQNIISASIIPPKISEELWNKEGLGETQAVWTIGIGNNVTVTNSGSTYFPALAEFYFSGTIPTTSKTVTITINASTVALAARTVNFGSTGSNNPSAGASWINFSGMSWSGGGNATLQMTGAVTDWQFSIDGIAGGSYVSGACSGNAAQSNVPNPGGFPPSFRAFKCGQLTTPTVTSTLSFSVPESLTHQAGGASTTFTWN